MKNKKIILSGPPSSGKTTIINELKKQGHNCMPEISPPNLDLSVQQNKLLLSEFLFSKRQDQYNTYHDQLSFYDRSLIDVIAYMIFWNECYPNSWNKTAHNLRYFNNVFYTPIWEDIYTQTDVRKETLEEAKKIDYFLRKVFKEFNYNIIEIPKLEVKKRTDFIINNL